MNKINYRAQKRFSQNFLHDRLHIDKIVEIINPQDNDWFFELGPGIGALSGELIDSSSRYFAAEIDRNLAQLLQQRYKKMRLWCMDGRKYLWQYLAQCLQLADTPERKWRFVSSVPYHITRDILVILRQQRMLFSSIHLILQSDVVDAICAPCGNSNYGRLSVHMQLLFACTPLLLLRPDAFSPAPKVDSRLMLLSPLSTKIKSSWLLQLDKLLVCAFSGKRKKLSNTLQPLLQAANLKLPSQLSDLRPQQISPQLYLQLAKQLDACNP